MRRQTIIIPMVVATKSANKTSDVWVSSLPLALCFFIPLCISLPCMVGVLCTVANRPCPSPCSVFHILCTAMSSVLCPMALSALSWVLSPVLLELCAFVTTAPGFPKICESATAARKSSRIIITCALLSLLLALIIMIMVGCHVSVFAFSLYVCTYINIIYTHIHYQQLYIHIRNKI